MKIFVRGLPADTSPLSLHAFADRILMPPWYQPFRRKIQVKRCGVMKTKDLELRTSEFHGLIEMTPYKAAMEAIERLNRQKFHGRLLVARKWHERSDLNDQRMPDGGLSAYDGNRRATDRRRPSLQMETYTPPSFQGLRQFHREFS